MIKKNKLFCLENNKPYKNYTKSCTFINSKHFHKSLSYYYFNLGRTCIKKKVDTYNKQLFHHFCSSEKKILIFHIMSTQTLFVLELTINTFLNTSKCVRLNSVSLPLLKKKNTYLWTWFSTQYDRISEKGMIYLFCFTNATTNI